MQIGFVFFNECLKRKKYAFASDYPRIVIVNNETNLGLTRSLNKGIGLSKGEYIARMDADDISQPKRFEKQVAFLDENQDISLCGTQIKEMRTVEQVSNYPLTHSEIKFDLLYYDPFAHPTVMWRKADFEKNSFRYNEEYKTAQDYELWCRVLKKLKAANLNEVLLDYRIHVNQVSIEKRSEQIETTLKIRTNLLRAICPAYSEDYPLFDLNKKITRSSSFYNELIERLKTLDTIDNINCTQQYYQVDKFSEAQVPESFLQE